MLHSSFVGLVRIGCYSWLCCLSWISLYNQTVWNLILNFDWTLDICIVWLLWSQSGLRRRDPCSSLFVRVIRRDWTRRCNWTNWNSRWSKRKKRWRRSSYVSPFYEWIGVANGEEGRRKEYDPSYHSRIMHSWTDETSDWQSYP